MIRFKTKKDGDPVLAPKPEKKVTAREAPADDNEAEAPAPEKKKGGKGWGKRTMKSGK